ncbi:MAG: cyclophilin-like fold protein, partial [Clostridia bacterium]|nr:cyclophilin-like fold protein [Clostridia bacterium]
MNNIKMVFENKEILIKLEDNIVTRELVKDLPVILSFEDYSRAEKIAYINKKYWIDNKSGFYCPAKGDLMFYAPWGYLALFYNDYI